MCWLLAVSVLFTAVTFSRYTGAQSGDAGTSLSRFACSYEISDVSASTFSNADYWLDTELKDTAMNTARTVRFAVRNHTLLPDGRVERISDVDLQSSLRLYAPAEFAGNLALQVAEVVNDEYITRTPQYVLGNLIYQVDGQSGEYEYVTDAEGNRMFAQYGGSDTELDTALFKDYEARGNHEDETLVMSGGFTSETGGGHTGTVSAYCESTQNRVTITAAMSKAEYCVGFSRGDVPNEGDLVPSAGSASLLYLDCEKVVPFYTVDISMPRLLFEQEDGAQARTFVLFITLLEHTENGDFDAAWGAQEMADLLVPPQKAGDAVKTFNGATVTGYHFEKKLPVVSLPDETKIGDTTVRVETTYDYKNGGTRFSFSHVAPLSEETATIVHPIEAFYDKTLTSQTSDFSAIADVQEYYGTCSNGGKSGYISFADVPGNPYYASYDNESKQGSKDYTIGEVLSKGYATKLNVLFVQVSEPAGGQ